VSAMGEQIPADFQAKNVLLAKGSQPVINQVNKESLREILIRHEGNTTDLRLVDGILHIGVGFNLEDKDVRKLMPQSVLDQIIVLDNGKVIAKDESFVGTPSKPGPSIIKTEEILKILDQRIEVAQKGAENFVGSKEVFGLLPEQTQEAIIDIVYNAGEGSVKGFRNMKENLLLASQSQSEEEKNKYLALAGKEVLLGGRDSSGKVTGVSKLLGDTAYRSLDVARMISNDTLSQAALGYGGVAVAKTLNDRKEEGKGHIEFVSEEAQFLALAIDKSGKGYSSPLKDSSTEAVLVQGNSQNQNVHVNESGEHHFLNEEIAGFLSPLHKVTPTVGMINTQAPDEFLASRAQDFAQGFQDSRYSSPATEAVEALIEKEGSPKKASDLEVNGKGSGFGSMIARLTNGIQQNLSVDQQNQDVLHKTAVSLTIAAGSNDFHNSADTSPVNVQRQIFNPTGEQNPDLNAEQGVKLSSEMERAKELFAKQTDLQIREGKEDVLLRRAGWQVSASEEREDPDGTHNTSSYQLGTIIGSDNSRRVSAGTFMGLTDPSGMQNIYYTDIVNKISTSAGKEAYSNLVLIDPVFRDRIQRQQFVDGVNPLLQNLKKETVEEAKEDVARKATQIYIEKLEKETNQMSTALYVRDSRREFFKRDDKNFTVNEVSFTGQIAGKDEAFDEGHVPMVAFQARNDEQVPGKIIGLLAFGAGTDKNSNPIILDNAYNIQSEGSGVIVGYDGFGMGVNDLYNGTGISLTEKMLPDEVRALEMAAMMQNEAGQVQGNILSKVALGPVSKASGSEKTKGTETQRERLSRLLGKDFVDGLIKEDGTVAISEALGNKDGSFSKRVTAKIADGKYLIDNGQLKYFVEAHGQKIDFDPATKKATLYTAEKGATIDLYKDQAREFAKSYVNMVNEVKLGQEGKELSKEERVNLMTYAVNQFKQNIDEDALKQAVADVKIGKGVDEDFFEVIEHSRKTDPQEAQRLEALAVAQQFVSIKQQKLDDYRANPENIEKHAQRLLISHEGVYKENGILKFEEAFGDHPTIANVDVNNIIIRRDQEGVDYYAFDGNKANFLATNVPVNVKVVGHADLFDDEATILGTINQLQMQLANADLGQKGQPAVLIANPQFEKVGDADISVNEITKKTTEKLTKETLSDLIFNKLDARVNDQGQLVFRAKDGRSADGKEKIGEVSNKSYGSFI
ncbi:MAG: hypothetical protein KC733_02430, partial [Candidatus Omnitrophica bacterium]|nr:hypothetical protein [Candidatus Omnitrophota bacterium]